MVKEAAGRPVVGVTFALYKDQEGGAPAWTETQNVSLDESGRYTVLLGSTNTEGLPKELFTSGEARWLGVQPEGQPEQARMVLLSVPYALKAGDADTVGGLPASAFVMSVPPAVGASTQSATMVNASAAPAASPSVTGSGTTNFLPIWTGTPGLSSTTLGNSTLFQTGGNVGIGNTNPAAKLDVSGNGIFRGVLQLPATGTASALNRAGFSSQPIELAASAWNASTAVNERFRWQTEPVGSNTVTATGKLSLLFASGTGTPVETGFSIASSGHVNFPSGQTFPGAGTITGVTPGTGLAGGGTSGIVALSLAPKACSAGQAMTALPFTCVSFATLGANSFTGNQSSSGNMSAKQLVSTVSTGTAPLQVASTTQVANLNASLLGGLTAGSFAKLSSNVFTGNQSIQNGVLAINAATPLSVSTLEVDVNAPGTLGPVLSLVNVGGALNAGAAVDFKTYGEVGSPYNPGARIEAVDVGNYADDITFLLNNPGAPSNGLVEPLRIAANSSEVAIVATGFTVPSGSNLSGTTGIQATGGGGDPSFINSLGGDGIDATGGFGKAEIGDAGFFMGNVSVDGYLSVTGQISAGTKDFKIDHPLDPANKYLLHSSVESSEMMNIYTGNVTLDPNGAARVQLPDWFETLNTDFRYQLTAIGAPAPNLYIAQEVASQQFGIAGGVPGMKVSWQITGVRHDAFALAHSLTVEVDKPARERGYYMHPELYGQSEEKQIGWARRPAMMKRMKEMREKQVKLQHATNPKAAGGQ
jgi:hypothetical protein